MRRYGLYDTTRGLTTALAAGVAGLLLWVATQVGTQTEGRFWASMGIVAGGGLVIALSQAVSGWTKGLLLRPSAGTFLIAFLPVLVCVGWVLLATQPAGGFAQGHVTSWSGSIGILGLIRALGLWHGVLAFGFGLVLGLSFDSVPAIVVEETPAAEPVAVADEPVVAERTEVHDQPVHTAAAPVAERERTPID